MARAARQMIQHWCRCLCRDVLEQGSLALVDKLVDELDEHVEARYLLWLVVSDRAEILSSF